MAEFVSDAFTDTDNTNLTAHTGATGASWTKHPSRNVDAEIRGNAAGYDGSRAILYASGTPSDDEYDVEADFKYFAASSSGYLGICGRMLTTALTYYWVYYNHSDGTWTLYKSVANSNTWLGEYTSAVTATTACKLEIKDATKKIFLAGTERISSTNNDLTAAGRVGVYFNGNNDVRLDNFSATEADAATAYYQSVYGSLPSPTGAAYKGMSASFAGSMPGASGAILKKTGIGVLGSLPGAAGGTVKKTGKNTTGSMPAPAGAMSKVGVFGRTFTGVMGALTGSIAKKTSVTKTGNMPASTGSIIKGIQVSRAGEVPAATGELSDRAIVIQAVAGDIPASTGGVASLFTAGRSLSGTIGAITGSIIKKIGKGLSGTCGAPSGAIQKGVGKNLQGELPEVTGSIAKGFITSHSASGIMGTITGALATVKNPVVFIRETFKILGSNLKRFLQ